jgi:hypothetical protein
MADSPGPRCPSCFHAFTLWNILKIFTPFQTWQCPFCGVSLRFKRPWILTATGIFLGGAVGALGLALPAYRVLSRAWALAAGILLVLVMELLVSFLILKTGSFEKVD